MNEILPIESGLAVLIPEAEDLVDPFRRRFDPSSALGVPAHVTILYPFIPPLNLTQEVISQLQKIFIQVPIFDVVFNEIMRFPGELMLAPEPAEPFRQMTRTIAEQFPDYPPYRGKFKEIIPHLTVAQVGETEPLDQITSDFYDSTLGRLPIQSKVREVSLLENSSGSWCVNAQFPLNQSAILSIR